MILLKNTCHKYSDQLPYIPQKVSNVADFSKQLIIRKRTTIFKILCFFSNENNQNMELEPAIHSNIISYVTYASVYMKVLDDKLSAS